MNTIPKFTTDHGAWLGPCRGMNRTALHHSLHNTQQVGVIYRDFIVCYVCDVRVLSTAPMGLTWRVVPEACTCEKSSFPAGLTSRFGCLDVGADHTRAYLRGGHNRGSAARCILSFVTAFCHSPRVTAFCDRTGKANPGRSGGSWAARLSRSPHNLAWRPARYSGSPASRAAREGGFNGLR
jgi:hypothetical protein